MALPSKAKDIVENVLKYFKGEDKNPDTKSKGKKSFIAKTSEATGISMRTVHRIQKGDYASLSSSEQTPRTEYKPIDDFDRVAIRNKITEFYTVRKQVPTIKSLHDALQVSIGFPGSTFKLKQVVRELGFRWKKTKSNRSILVERDSVFQLRMKYYERKKSLKEAGYTFVFTDETWIDSSYTSPMCWQGPGTDSVREPISKGQRLIIVHAGSSNGFVPGALLIYKASSATGDYHHEMNGENFLKWLKEKLLPNLTQKSAIVMDNASYHCVQYDKRPSSSTRKSDIKKWLDDHSIPYEDSMLRPQLLALARLHKTEPTYILDDVIRAAGHEILRLPPYHPDLNPIELIWQQVKHIVKSRNVTHTLTDILELTKAAFDEITKERWEHACRHAEHCETDYRARDIVIDSVVDKFIIDLGADIDDTTDTASEGEDM